MNPFVYYGYVQPHFSYPVSPYDRHGTVQHKEALAMPDNLLYTTAVEPQFTEQFFRHIGLMIVITTTVGKLAGTLEAVCMDHV
ncbi:hypothetical protein BZG17_32475, partial [Escherichia coli]|nr:hypothetical protein [Escherichia coli]